MNKVIIPVIASILILGVIGLSYDVFADKENNNGKAKGCENSNENSKAKEHNPHCNTAFTVCDFDENGGISPEELLNWFEIHGVVGLPLSFTEEIIQFIEYNIPGATQTNQIDNQVELDDLNWRLVEQFGLTPGCF